MMRQLSLILERKKVLLYIMQKVEFRTESHFDVVAYAENGIAHVYHNFVVTNPREDSTNRGKIEPKVTTN